MQFSQKMPLYFFYTMVQKSQKWPKTQIKGVLPYSTPELIDGHASPRAMRFIQRRRLKIEITDYKKKLVMSVVRICANFKQVLCHLNGAMYPQVKRPFEVLLFSTSLSLFIAGFLSSIANASRIFRSFIPVALMITCTLCQWMSCDPFLPRICSELADVSGWLSRIPIPVLLCPCF